VFFGDFGLISYGRRDERWRLALGPFNNVNGHGSSPVLVDDLVVLLATRIRTRSWWRRTRTRGG
jgi:hypothetical protein